MIDIRVQKYREFLIALLIAAFFIPAKYVMIYITPSDYQIHIGDAQKYFETLKFFGAPHFLFEALVILYKVVFQSSWSLAGLLVDISFYILLAKMIFTQVFSLSQDFKRSVLVTFLLILSWPIFLLYFLDNRFYGGYIGTNVFHNPTMVLLKPLALYVHLKLMSALVDKKWSFNQRQSLLISLVMILGTLAKPNYSIVLLLALGISFLLGKGKLSLAPWRQITLYVVAPVVALLGIQFLSHFGKGVVGDDSSRGIIFAPFEVFGQHSNVYYLLPKYLLSMAFPLVVLLVYFKSIKSDFRLKFAWLCFVIGSFYTYFLAESGPDLPAGNFGWSSQISLFILFVESVLFLLDSSRRGSIKHRYLVAGILLLHGICGVIAYINVSKIS